MERTRGRAGPGSPEGPSAALPPTHGFDSICRHFYDPRPTLNASASMVPARIMCAALAVMLSTASCINWQTADRRSPPRAVPEPSSVGSSAPGDSIAGRVPGEATGQPPASVALLRELRRDGTPADRRLRDPYGPGEDRDTWERIRHLMTVVPVQSHVSSLREFRRKLRRYHGNQRFFDAIGSNASPWLYHVTRQLADAGAPGRDRPAPGGGERLRRKSRFLPERGPVCGKSCPAPRAI